MRVLWWSPKHTWEDSERRAAFVTFSLCMSHCRFTLVFLTRPVYRRGRCALVLVMPARPRIAISGILAGGSRVSTLRLFYLAPVGRWCFWFCPSVALMDGLLGTRHTSCLVIALFTSSSWCFHSTDSCFCGSLCGLFLFAGSFCGLVCFCCVWSCFLFFLVFSVEWHHTAWHHESRKLATVSASLAVISTASKYLHNDLAKAIKALEHKKNKFVPETDY